MSHVKEGEATVEDLDALEAACANLGLELVRGQKTYKWWGHHVGDYPVPAGFKADEIGHCEHAIRVKGDPNAYEIGLVRRRDGQPGFVFLYDFYGGGMGLMKHVSKDYGPDGRLTPASLAESRKRGEDTLKLQHEYAAVKSIRRAQRLGYRHTLTRNPAGMVQKLSIYR